MGNLTRNFSDWEFACKGKCNDDCKAVMMQAAFMEKLQALRDLIGRSIKITSGIRCSYYNTTIPGAAQHSWHIPRNGIACAADIRTSRSREDVLALYAAADHLGFRGIGLYDGRIHVDMRPTKRARWVDKSWDWS
jgi:hypothetical protein